MTETIPEWALHEAAQIWCEKNHAAKQMDAAMADSIARALTATAARVERERRDTDAALAKSAWLTVALEMDMDADRAESLCYVTSEAIAALPLKYGEPQ